MKEKILETIELMDSLVQYPHGNEHCILPEHYNELADDLVKLFAIPVVSNNEVECKWKESCGHDYCNLDECPEYETKTNEVAVCYAFDWCKIKTKKGNCRKNCKHYAVKQTDC